MESQDLVPLAQQSVRDALAALRVFGPSPAAGLPAAFAAAQPPLERARNAGIAMGLAFAVAVMLAYLRLASGIWVAPGVGQLLKAFLFGVVYFGSLAGALALARVTLRGQSEFSAVVFASGAACLPLGGWALASGILGFVNLEVVAILAVFAVCWTVLLIHSACVHILKLSEPRAAMSVPIVLLLTGWLGKVLFTSFLI
jgi:hypothetical protein